MSLRPKFLPYTLTLSLAIATSLLSVHGDVVTWDGSTDATWDDPTNWSTGSKPTAADDVVLPTPVPGATATISLGSGEAANSLSFVDTYTLAGGDLALSSGGVSVAVGESARITSTLTGTAGLTKTGYGILHLGNSANLYTGATTINAGTLVVSDAAALGSDTSAVVVSGTIARPQMGGQLVLGDSSSTGMTFTRDILLSGGGPTGDGVALLSVGNNTLSGTVATSSGTTRLASAYGTTRLGTLAMGSSIWTNLTGNGNWSLTNAIAASTGNLEKAGSGTLVLNGTNLFSGVLRISGGSVRVSSNAALGTSTSASALDLNGGLIEIRTDTPDFASRKVTVNASSTIFVDHAIGSSVLNQTVDFSDLVLGKDRVLTVNGRNGYGVSISGASGVIGLGTGNNGFTNNSSGLLTVDASVWSMSNTTTVRGLTLSGTGNTVITGSILATGLAHTVTKSGTGTVTIEGTASTYTGVTTIQAGNLIIRGFGALGADPGTSTTAVNFSLNSNTTTLTYLGEAGTGAGETTSRAINLAGTTGGARINANQTGTAPTALIFTSDFTATGAGSKTLTLGGNSTLDNEIRGAIVNNGGTNLTSVTKSDDGTWVLSGANEYTGATTVNGGTLKIKDTFSTSSRNVIQDASAIVFNANSATQYAGGTLEYVGADGQASTETLGALTPTAGSGTIKVTPTGSGSASLVFSSLGTVNGASSVNFVVATGGSVTLTGTGATPNMVNAALYYNGADFAYSDGGLLRAPVYGTDSDFATSDAALTASSSNEITGSFSSGAMTINSLKISGSQTLNLTGALQIYTLVSNASGGILQTGGSGAITGTGVTTAGSGAMVIRVNEASDVLTLSAPVMSDTTGGLTKTGLGTLISEGANTQDGATSINEGTVRLSGSGRLSGSSSSTSLAIRQGATLDLNGVSTGTSIDDLNGAGRVTNSSSTAATFQVGNSNGTGTFSGIIEDGTGVVSVTKRGSGNQTWSGLNTYSGVTTIGSTGIVTVTSLANIGEASGIGTGDDTSDATNAASLVFNGTSSSQAFGGLSYNGTASVSTDRLFTLNGSTSGGARIQANGVNNATLVFSNPGALRFGSTAAGKAQGLVLGGSSIGDNLFNLQIVDNGSAATSVYKADSGLWILGNDANSYTGKTTISGGVLQAVDGKSLPTASALVINGGVLETSGTFNRSLGTGAGQVQWTANGNGGFSAAAEKLTVDLGSTPTWGSTANFLGTGNLVLSSSTALSDVELASGFVITPGVAAIPTVTTAANSTTITITTGTTAGLTVGQAISGTNIAAGSTIVAITGDKSFVISQNATAAGTLIAATITAGGVRQVQVNDNPNTNLDYATISGTISGGGSLAKIGSGELFLTGPNTYTGDTRINAGTLRVITLDGSGGSSSVGAASGAVSIGNVTTSGRLNYVGAGETTDRRINLAGTTGSATIDASGYGALELTNVVNAGAGIKTLTLRGYSNDLNEISSSLTDNSGALSITKSDSGTWILSGDNNYSGATTVTNGALGIGSDTALGTGTLTFNNTSGYGAVFASEGDRNLSNAVLMSGTGSIGYFYGAHALTFSTLTEVGSLYLDNYLADGKALTFTGAVTLQDTSIARTMTVRGTGLTVFQGTVQNGGTAAGSLTLAGTSNAAVLRLANTGTANSYTGSTTITRGTLQLGADDQIPDGSGFGNLVMNAGTGAAATLDLNGHSETINGLTATTAGSITIDNSSASAATLTFGGNNQVVTFGSTSGAFAITNSGGGALSITKTGSGAATITNAALTYTGSTSVEGGTLTIHSPLNGTSGLSVTGGTLNLVGGLSAPSSILSVRVDGGSTLNLADGSGMSLASLTSLSLGSGTGTATLGIELGTATTSDLLVTSGTATTANTVRFNVTGLAGFGAGTYDLLTAAGGGLGGASYSLGMMPGGYTYTFTSSPTTVLQLVVAANGSGSVYWNGDVGSSWSNYNDGNTNWSSTLDGTTDFGSNPGALNTVIFGSTAATGTTLSTTLDNHFSVNALKFTANPSGVTAVSIAPGSLATSSLTIAPASASDGIEVADNAGAISISTAVVLGASQTWSVAGSGANGSSLTVSGNITGAAGAGVTKTGNGVLTLSGQNAYEGGLTLSAGTLNINSATALGSGTFTIGDGTTIDNGSAAAMVLAANNAQIWEGSFTFTGTRALDLGTGAVTLDADSTVTVGANVLSVGGVINDGASSFGLTKAGAGTLTLGGENTFDGGVTLSAGTLNINSATALGTGTFTIGDGTTINNTSGAAVALSTDNPQFWNGSFTFTGSNPLDLGSGAVSLNAASTVTVSSSTLTVGGTISSGTNSYSLTKAGSGTLNLSSASTFLGDFVATAGNTNFQGTGTTMILGSLQIARNAGTTAGLLYNTAGATLRVGDGSADVIEVGVNSSGGTSRGVLDLRGLESFVADVSYFRVGSLLTGAVSGAGGTVYFAKNNSITASTAFTVGDNGGVGGGVSVPSTLTFGAGTSTVSTPAMTIGGRKGNVTTLTIDAGGTLTLNNGAGRTDLLIADNNISTGNNATATVDMTGGTLNALLNNLISARKGASNGTSTGTFTLGASDNVVDANRVTIGTSSASANASSATLNFGGGTFDIVEDVSIGLLSNTTGTASITGTLNLAGGVFTVGGSIVTTNSNASTSVINLNGGTLDMTGGSISVDTLNVYSGTLKNVGQLYDQTGTTAVDLVKTTTGTLVLEGTVGYTGNTTVNAGAVQLANGQLTGGVIVNEGGTLKGNGEIGGGIVVNSGGHLAPGTSSGVIRVHGDPGLVLNAGSQTDLEFFATDDYDQLIVDGSVVLNGGDLNLSGLASLDSSGDAVVMTIIDNDGTSDLVTGHFSTAWTTQGGFDYSDLGNGWYLYYNVEGLTGTGGLQAGNNVVITNVPEPSSLAMLAGAGAAAILLWRRRRRMRNASESSDEVSPESFDLLLY